MGRAWAEHPSWELVADASEVAERDIGHLLLDAGAEELKAPRNAQVSTFVLSLLVLDAVERTGLAPALCAGHSLGEYTALTATGCLSFDEGVRLVAARGEAMQAAAEDNPGTMSAILGLDDEDADAACRRADGDVWVANYNAPGQIVIAGAVEAVQAAAAIAKTLGAKKVLPLPVGGAFHTPYMAPARDALRKALAEATFHELEVPLVANVDAKPHADPEEWRSLLSAQLASPVRWRQSLLRLAEEGVTRFVELGPGGVLTGMVKRTVPEAQSTWVGVPTDIDKLLEAVHGTSPVLSTHHEGEHLYMLERMVVSPAAGVFTPDAAEGSALEVGGRLGLVSGEEVRSPFEGRIMGMLAQSGERVTAGQPIAWLRVS